MSYLNGTVLESHDKQPHVSREGSARGYRAVFDDAVNRLEGTGGSGCSSSLLARGGPNGGGKELILDRTSSMTCGER